MSTIPLESLKSNPRNPRTISQQQMEKLKRSIQEFPKMMRLRPIIIDGTNTVLGGNMRMRALKELGFVEIPEDWVRQAGTLSEEEMQRFVIADNVGFGDWDLELLDEDFDIKDLQWWGLDIDMGIDEDPEPAEDNFEVPSEVETDIEPGDVFQIGPHRLLCGDATLGADWDELLQGRTADLVLTDPPYNVDYTGKTKDALKIKNDVMADDEFFNFLLDFYTAGFSRTKEGGGWYIWHADTHGLKFRAAFEEAGFLMKQCLVWVKNTMVLGRQDYQWKHEPCLYGWKPGAAHYFTPDRDKTTVWTQEALNINKLKKEELKELLKNIMAEQLPQTVLNADKPARSAHHPTMKPILLLAPLIQNSTKPEQLVVDPFIGSGSTMVAAHQTKRVCFGIEMDPAYCEVVIMRMRELDPTLTITRNGKKYE